MLVVPFDELGMIAISIRGEEGIFRYLEVWAAEFLVEFVVVCVL